MNISFLNLFFEKTDFPQAARDELRAVAEKCAEEIDVLLTQYQERYDHEATATYVEAAAQRIGVHTYSLWMLLLIFAAEKARPLYRTEQLYWDTFTDLRYKVQECYDVYGIWGNFVAFWYPIFYDGTIVKLGRLEYQIRPCPLKEPKTAMGMTINPGDPVLYIHIPTSFEPFDRAARWDSYKQAWQYFCPDGKPLVCICSSWLLYPGYGGVFKPDSNIAQFRKEFTMIGSKQTESFSNIWRVFGKDHKLEPQQLPEQTSLQRAFKDHILNSGTHGSGTGVLVFDGEKLLSGSEVRLDIES